MTKYLTAALAAVALALGLFAWVQAGRIAALQADIQLVTAERDTARVAHQLAEAIITDRDQQLRKLQRQQAQRQKDLDRVLQDNRTWADQPVPPGVADWLRQRATADGPGTPADAPAGLSAP